MVSVPLLEGKGYARETVARVAAGAFAEEILAVLYPEIKVIAYVDQVGRKSVRKL